MERASSNPKRGQPCLNTLVNKKRCNKFIVYLKHTRSIAMQYFNIRDEGRTKSKPLEYLKKVPMFDTIKGFLLMKAKKPQIFRVCLAQFDHVSYKGDVAINGTFWDTVTLVFLQQRGLLRSKS